MAVPTQLSNVRFKDQKEKDLFDEAMLGQEVREFLNGTTGQFLHERAKLERMEVADEISELDPYTPEGKRRFEKLKFRKMCADNFMKWCIEAITNGQNAEVQLDQYRDDE